MAFVFLAIEFGSTLDEVAKYCHRERSAVLANLHKKAIKEAEANPIFGRILIRMANDFRMVQVWRYTTGDTTYTKGHLPQNLYQGYGCAM
jgi:hypothetical protein